MSVIFEHQEKGSWVFSKGAVERVFEVCTNIGDKEQVLRQMEKFASQGLVCRLLNFTDLARACYCPSTMDREG